MDFGFYFLEGEWWIDGTRGGKCKAMLHGREGEERKKDHRHMWTGPTRGNSAVAGDDVSNSFFKVILFFFCFNFWGFFYLTFWGFGLFVWRDRMEG